MATYSVAAYPMTQEGSSSSNLRYPAWQREYEVSLVELDSKKLLECVHKAEAAIFNRLQGMAQSSASLDNKAERQAMEDALANLRVLKRNNLGFPDWKKE